MSEAEAAANPTGGRSAGSTGGPAPRRSPPFKYGLVPAWVTSERTGLRHYVSAADLVRLYGLAPGTYRVLADKPDVVTAVNAARRQGVIVLMPRADGSYVLPDDPGPDRPAVSS